MSAQERFDLAVAIVQALPKDGAVKPSDDTRLKFYAYFKQAKEGKCNKPKPGMLQLVEKAKWNAWNELGDLAAEEAMGKYADELKKTLQQSSLNDVEPADLKANMLKLVAM